MVMNAMPARDTVISTLTLFTSVSTLLCCALPALLVAVGAGAVLAGVLGAVPQIVFFSEHKPAVFAIAGVMLAASATLRILSRNAPCPADPGQAASCNRIRRWGGRVLAASIILYAIGFFFAFLAVNLLG